MEGLTIIALAGIVLRFVGLVIKLLVWVTHPTAVFSGTFSAQKDKGVSLSVRVEAAKIHTTPKRTRQLKRIRALRKSESSPR
jgi:hypothetical protein